MIIKSDKRSITGYNDVCGVHIVYNIEYRTTDEPENVIGQIEVNDERIGVINIHRDGQMYISFEKGCNLAAIQQSEIISTVISDADSIFNPAEEGGES
ncbi:MAG: hypothetical protein SPE11_09905 [Parabacteroides sp.]|nr:hypothetical protein [Parabacteroides sp.]